MEWADAKPLTLSIGTARFFLGRRALSESHWQMLLAGRS
jgi:hypothetical protein